jgi:hypothetical protein
VHFDFGGYDTVKRAIVLTILACGFLAATTLLAGITEIPAAKDNTLYESQNGTLSNGSGIYTFTGVTAFSEIRRGLVTFDIAGAVPAGATIDNVTLTLQMSKTIAPALPVSLHRALKDWGEGASDAGGEEGTGTTAAAGDATWIHTFSPTDFWDAAGGDFENSASATELVDAEGLYSSSSEGMVLDVQSWLDDPSSNFGWVVVGDESASVTAKRFNSRENETGPPVLSIEFSGGNGDGGGDGGVPASSDTMTLLTAALLLLLGTGAVLRRRATPTR